MYTYLSGTHTLFASYVGEVPSWTGVFIMIIFMKLSALNTGKYYIFKILFKVKFTGKYYYNLNQHTYTVVLHLE